MFETDVEAMLLVTVTLGTFSETAGLQVLYRLHDYRMTDSSISREREVTDCFTVQVRPVYIR